MLVTRWACLGLGLTFTLLNGGVVRGLAPAVGGSVGPIAGACLGHAMTVVGDQDGDGVEDVAVSAPCISRFAKKALPSVKVLSGATWQVLWSAREEGFTGFGQTLCCPGDLDEDGKPDLVIGAPMGAQGAGMVGAYSCFAEKPLWSIRGSEFGSLGKALATTPPCGKDKCQGVLVGDPHLKSADGSSVGQVRLLSGRDGGEVWSIVGDRVGPLFGMSVCAVADCDKDGNWDVAVGAPWGVDRTPEVPEPVRILSGRSGKTIGALENSTRVRRAGWFLHGDGPAAQTSNGTLYVSVEMVGEKDSGTRRSGFVAYSGPALARKTEFESPGGLDGTGKTVLTCGDLDKDGVRDLILGVPGGSMKDGHPLGAVRAISGKDFRLIWECPGKIANSKFGFSIALMHGTGPLESQRILVGAPWAKCGDLDNAGLVYELDMSGKVLREIGGTR